MDNTDVRHTLYTELISQQQQQQVMEGNMSINSFRLKVFRQWF